MIYGLHSGRVSSLRWLLSMAVSLAESVFITQPLKVLGFSAFFALVLRRADDEEELELPLLGHLSGPVYLGFLWMLLLVAYGQRNPSAYHFNRHLERSLTRGFSDVLGF
ncbi:Polycystic kidney disease protein 1-like 2 [Fukomys damarensis]|uniref:Polycystic kidney disease protein 1-like 2 n=1 Tax=Fukomys damarensis TaxID=885580 RepID=A0A091CTI2_FUKDA|nr:Polycystic kidney disease protein 1-like 2 [Fukomys damarensis]